MSSVDQSKAASFDAVGAAHFPGAASQLLPQLHYALARWPDGASGTRLADDPLLGGLLGGKGVICGLVEGLIGQSCFPVRAIYFDKNDTSNWALGWHQDRTIAVAARHELPGFGPWTVKQGLLHVQPPFDIIASLRTVRIHLDAVPSGNGPLLVVPGSHRFGLIAADRAAEVAAAEEILACLAEAGDIWAYHTPILHASERSAPGQRRRVLQVDYATGPLPQPLEWLGL